MKTMNSRLEITWEGHVPGIDQHRLSIGSFGDSLTLLLKAYRRIASNMLRDAVDAKTLRDKRLNKHAAWLDLQVEAVGEGSVRLVTAGVLTTPQGEQRQLFENLSARAGVALLEAIEAEADGKLQSKGVRNYLSSLPAGITAHKYDFRLNGTSKTVSIRETKLAEEPTSTAHFLEIEGRIVSVGFEPGEAFITVDPGTGKGVKAGATAEMVNRALELREVPVTMFMVVKGKPRALNIRPVDEPLASLTEEEHEEALFGKWDGLLKRLAQ